MASVTKSPAATDEVTYEQFMAMPETTQPTEVIDGVIVEMPMPTFRHQRIVARIGHRLDDFVDSRELGVAIFCPVDIVVRKRPKLKIRQPDASFFSNARAGFRVVEDLDRLQNEGHAPDLAIEVLSPGQNERTLAEKLTDYASIRVEEVWFVDQTTKTIRVLARDGNGYRLAGEFKEGDRVISAVLAGIDLDVSAVFA